MWVAAAGVCVGALGGEARLGVFGAAAVVVLAGACMAFAAPARRTLPALFCFAAGLSALHVGSSSAPSSLAVLARSVPRCEVTGRILESHGKLGTLVAVERVGCEHADARGASGVAIVDDLAADPGSSIRAQGWVLPLSDDDFDAARRRVGAGAELDITHHTLAPPTALLHRTSALLRSSLRTATSRLPERRAGLLRGLAIGDTELIDDEMNERFRRSGLSHLVAVSGSNVAIVVGAIALAAARLSLRARIVLSLLALALYVAVVGPDPSVLRAAAMGTMMLVAIAAGRTTEPLAALGIAVVVCVGLRPELAAAPGLHLSVAATAGIVIGARRLQGCLALLPRPVATLLSVTLAAQVAVAPILIATFGELSLIGPLANLVAVPLVAPATVATLVAGVIAPLMPQLVPILMWPADISARWILACADFFGGLTFASVSVPTWVAALALVPLLVVAVRAYKVTAMSTFHWRTLDAEGNEVSRSDEFDSKAAAEAWMGAEWEGLVELGGDSVSLRSDGDEIYNMSLRPA